MTVYLVEYVWYGTFKHLAAYTDAQVAIEHAQHPETLKAHGKDNIVIREIGVRTRLQFGEPYERTIYEKGNCLIDFTTLPKPKDMQVKHGPKPKWMQQ